jgi:hypothetical protein
MSSLTNGLSLASLFSRTLQDTPNPTPTAKPIAEEEEFYSSTSLLLICILLILSLWTSYYLQIKRIRAVLV